LNKQWLIKSFLNYGGERLLKAFFGSVPIILMYHRFSELETPRTVDVESFENQIKWLKGNYNVICLSELVDCLAENRAVPTNSVVITIDDGYSDFYQYAYPILERYSVPATFYVTSGFIDGVLWLWPDKVRYILESTGNRHLDLTSISSVGRGFDIERLGVEAVWQELVDLMTPLEPREKQKVLTYLEGVANVHVSEKPADEYAAVSWDDIRTMDPSLITIGGHTRSHPILSTCDECELNWEIEGCKLDIEEQLQRPVEHFCYPNGQLCDYDGRVISTLYKVGFRSATVTHFEEDPFADQYQMRRYNAPVNLLNFRKVVSKARHLSGLVGR